MTSAVTLAGEPARDRIGVTESVTTRRPDRARRPSETSDPTAPVGASRALLAVQCGSAIARHANCFRRSERGTDRRLVRGADDHILLQQSAENSA